jgi:hypothetical protein
VNLNNVFQSNIGVGFAFQILNNFPICLRFEMRIRLDLELESCFLEALGYPAQNKAVAKSENQV